MRAVADENGYKIRFPSDVPGRSIVYCSAGCAPSRDPVSLHVPRVACQESYDDDLVCDFDTDDSEFDFELDFGYRDADECSGSDVDDCVPWDGACGEEFGIVNAGEDYLRTIVAASFQDY